MEEPSTTNLAAREEKERARLLKSRFLIGIGCSWLILDLVLQVVSLLPCPGSYLSDVSVETFLTQDLAARFAQISPTVTECRHFMEGTFTFMGFTCGAFSTATFLAWHVIVGQHRAECGTQP